MIETFVLEDNPDRVEEFKKNWSKYANFTFSKSYYEALEKFDFTKRYDILLLDHDLGGRVMISSNDENSGGNFVNYIKDYQYKDIDVIIHSHNPLGSNTMKNRLDKAGFSHVKLIPFGTLMKGWEHGFIAFGGQYKFDEV
jgi:CheY-like chemotaxis protein